MPTYDVSAVLTSIQSLLDEPNPQSPANALAAKLYKEDQREYKKRVQAIVEQSWMDFDSGDEAATATAEEMITESSVQTMDTQPSEEPVASLRTSSSG